MSASANIVSFLLIESCRLEPFPKGTILSATEVLKISIVTIFADPNDMWREWKIKFLNVVDNHAPLRTKRVCSKRSQKDYFRVEKTYAWTRNHEVESRWVNTFKRTHKIGMKFNEFATKLTVKSRSQRNLITNNHLLNTKMTLDAPGKL